MINLSMIQAIDVWMELEDACNGTNGFGGNTAEIYAHRLMPCSPLVNKYLENPESLTSLKEFVEEDLLAVKQSFVNLLLYFEQCRDVKIFIDDMTLRQWNKKNRFFIHREHVRVKQRGRR